MAERDPAVRDELTPVRAAMGERVGEALQVARCNSVAVKPQDAENRAHTRELSIGRRRPAASLQ